MSSALSQSPYNTHQTRPRRRLVQMQKSTSAPSTLSSLPRLPATTTAGTQGAETAGSHAFQSFLPTTSTWATRSTPTAIACDTLTVNTVESVDSTMPAGVEMQRHDSAISLDQDWSQAQDKEDLSFLEAPEIKFADGSIVTVAQAQAQLYGTGEGTSIMESPPCKSLVPPTAKVAATAATPTSTSFGMNLRIGGTHPLSRQTGLMATADTGRLKDQSGADEANVTATENDMAAGSPIEGLAVASSVGAADVNETTANANHTNHMSDTNDAKAGENSNAGNATCATNTNANAGASTATAGQTADNQLLRQQHAVQEYIAVQHRLQGLRRCLNESMQNQQQRLQKYDRIIHSGKGTNLNGIHKKRKEIADQTRQQVTIFRKQIDILQTSQQQKMMALRAVGVAKDMIKVLIRQPSVLTEQATLLAEQEVEQALVQATQQVGQRHVTEKSTEQVQVEAYQEFGQRQASIQDSNYSISVAENSGASIAAGVSTNAITLLNSNPATKKLNLPRGIVTTMECGGDATPPDADAQGGGVGRAGLLSCQGMMAGGTLGEEDVAGTTGLDQDIPAAQGALQQTDVGRVGDQMDHEQSNAAGSGGVDTVGTGQADELSRVNMDTIIANGSAATKATSASADRSMPTSRDTVDHSGRVQLSGAESTETTSLGMYQMADMPAVETSEVTANGDARTGVGPGLPDISGVLMANMPTSSQQKSMLLPVDVADTTPRQFQEGQRRQQHTATKIQQHQQQQEQKKQQQLQQLPMGRIKEVSHQPLALVLLKPNDWAAGLHLAYGPSGQTSNPWRYFALQPPSSASIAATPSCFDPPNLATQSPAGNFFGIFFDLFPSSFRTFLSLSSP
ncbi:hypothetical protein BG015_011901 [Linnemannia schmuckeri]|uniref:Uncharacterized protein n=1 Tax=Linnemannia schmuckeri TaxID=64567 RepID=A0A9P5V7J4_9FUNG|nr:hypothetical protein BG015_011901 [Linnemannia schmuckeri]